MSFQVVDGRIPDVVERFLREYVGVRLEHRSALRWLLACHVEDQSFWCEFDWPHDREPTLQEAIEEVMHRTDDGGGRPRVVA